MKFTNIYIFLRGFGGGGGVLCGSSRRQILQMRSTTSCLPSTFILDRDQFSPLTTPQTWLHRQYVGTAGVAYSPDDQHMHLAAMLRQRVVTGHLSPNAFNLQHDGASTQLHVGSKSRQWPHRMCHTIDLHPRPPNPPVHAPWPRMTCSIPSPTRLRQRFADVQPS